MHIVSRRLSSIPVLVKLHQAFNQCCRLSFRMVPMEMTWAEKHTKAYLQHGDAAEDGDETCGYGTSQGNLCIKPFPVKCL